LEHSGAMRIRATIYYMKEPATGSII